MDRRRPLLFVLAAALLVPIVLSAMRLAELDRTDEALEAVEDRLQRNALGPAIGALRKIGQDAELSARQQARRDDLLRRIVEQALAVRHPVRRIGMHEFSPGTEDVLAFGADSVSIQARIKPRELGDFLVALRFSDQEVALHKGALSHKIALPKNGEPLALSLAAVVRLPDGTTTEVPIEGALRLRQDRSRPKVVITIGDRVFRPGQEPLTASVPPGAPVEVRISDAMMLERTSVTLEGETDSHDLGGQAAEDMFRFLPDRFENGGRRDLVIRATNRLDNRTIVTLHLDVKGKDWLPVAGASFAGKALDDGDNIASKSEGRLIIKLEPGVTQAIAGLSLTCDGVKPPPSLEEVDGTLVADLTLKAGAKTGVSLWRGNTRLKTWLITVDEDAPMVRLDINGMELKSGVATLLQVGSTMWVTARDNNGIAKLLVDGEGLGPARGERRDRRSLSRQFDVTAGFKGPLAVVAVDTLGNAKKATWQIRARRAIRLTSLRANDEEVGLDPITQTDSAVALSYAYEGEGILLWSLHDGDGAWLASDKIALKADSSGTVDVDLHIKDATEATREIRLQDALAHKNLAKVMVKIDRLPPTLRIAGWDPSKDGPRSKLQATPGSRLVIEVEDASGPATVEVTGSVVVARNAEGKITRVTIGVPDSLPANIVVRARDAAGNRNGIALQLVTPSAIPALALNLLLDGRTIQHDGPILVKRPSELSARIENGELVGARLGGTEIPVEKTGALKDPVSVPAAGPLELTVRDLAGAERTLRFEVSLLPFSLTKKLFDRLNAARQLLRDGKLAEARSEATAIERAVNARLSEFLDPGKSDDVLNEIRQLKRDAGGQSDSTHEETPEGRPGATADRTARR